MGRMQLGTVLAVAVYLFGYAYTFRTLSLAFANIAGGFVLVLARLWPAKENSP